MVVSRLIDVLYILMILGVMSRFFLGNINLVRVVHGLIHGDVHLFKEDAICGNAVTLLHVDDITHHQLTHRHRMRSTILAAVDDDDLPVDLVLEAQELLILGVVADGCNERGREDSHEDGEALDVAAGVAHVGEEEVQGGDDEEEDDVAILELQS